ncbi:MAG: tetratricopeptide repeat protein [Lachnospiraceae bacterium]
MEQGVGVEKDPKEAVLWYQKAALHGHATGMNNLGACYERGNGVEKDEQAALMWYERAAERGSSYGCRNAARFYQDGKGAPKDEKRQRNIWKNARCWETATRWCG